MLLGPSKLLGVVFDISLRHSGSHRVIDQVKKSLIQFVSTFDEEDGFYLFHPELSEPFYNRGEHICMIANYETDGFKFDLGYALKQTLYVVGAQDPDMKKSLCLITDRLTAKDTFQINHLATLNEKDDLGCQIIVIGIGGKYNKENLFESCQGKVFCIHTDDPLQVNSILVNWFDDSPAELEITASEPEES